MADSEVSNHTKIPQQLDLIILDYWQGMVVLPSGSTQRDMEGNTEVPMHHLGNHIVLIEVLGRSQCLTTSQEVLKSLFPGMAKLTQQSKNWESHDLCLIYHSAKDLDLHSQDIELLLHCIL